MIRISSIDIFIILTSCLVSCRSIYTPTTPNTPLFQNKKQIQIESTAFTNGLNLKTAYTPINHLAIQLNGQYSQEFDQPNPNRKYHQYLEGAIGTYYCFKNNSVIELYGGYGQGASKFGDPIISNETLLVRAKGHYEKYYAQINFGSHKLIDDGLIGVCIRAGNIRYSYTDANFNWLINTTADHYALEPYFFINNKITKRLSFVGNFGLTMIQGLSNDPYAATMRTSILNIGFGLRLSFGNKTE
ncbi:MAG: hypothetical protein QM534_13620 [Sediminibacterium sp.]|nr:hypothetical protein [Sediminibacterium sp.]